MTQNEKDLLMKDLCARLPHGVKVLYDNQVKELQYIEAVYNEVKLLDSTMNYTVDIEEVKPYLFPLSSMTEEQFEELKDFAGLKYEGNTLELVEWDSTCDKTLEFWLEEIPSYCVIKVFDWLNKNHFDYRGLIPMGLAIDATELNIY